MSSNDYHFITHWSVTGTLEEVTGVLSDATDLPRWWPSVYLDVEELAPGDARGIGKKVKLYTKGWLPYTLRWQFEVTEITSDGFSLQAQGDFDGRGVWSFAQRGPVVHITYDWRIRADKPLLRRLSFVMKPFFAANHRWAMAKGETSLKLELARRRATNDRERALIPPPPPATTARPFLRAATVAFLLPVVYRLLRRSLDPGTSLAKGAP